MPSYAPTLGWIILVIASTSIIIDVMRYIGGNRLVRVRSLYDILAMSYGVGVALKVTLLGPAFVRWHLADIGFPLVLSILVFMTAGKGYISAGTVPYKFRLEQDLEVLLVKRYSLLGALGISYAYEIFMGLVYARYGTDIILVGNFDWVDVACYTLGVFLGWKLLIAQENILRPVLLRQQQADQDATRAAKLATRKARKSKRKR